MGYYVETTDCNIFVKKEDFPKIYEKMCKLNDRDDLKTGGGGYDPNYPDCGYNTPRPEGLNYHPCKWFAWMPANYPAEFKTFEEILRNLGFDYTLDDDGNLFGLFYNDKTGAEQEFLETLVGFVDEDSYIDWRGEEGSMWRMLFTKDGVKYLTGTVVYPND